LDDTTVGGDLGLDTGGVVHAVVVGVVRVVVGAVDPIARVIMSSEVVVQVGGGDLRIRSSTSAGIARSRVAKGGAGLRRCITDGVTWGGAPSLKGWYNPAQCLAISSIPSSGDADKLLLIQIRG
jgi:hypothetical protein